MSDLPAPGTLAVPEAHEDAPPALDVTTLAIAEPTPPAPEDAVPPSPVLRRRSPVQLLVEEPYRFDFDQAVSVTAHGRDPLTLRYRTVARLNYAWGEVLAARPERGELTLGTFGLTGPGGVLPRHFTATVAQENRKRSHALHAFLDMAGSRLVGLYALAGVKYQPTRDPALTDRVLSATIGMATPGLEKRLTLSLPTLLYHAGNLASRSRSAERL
ncbi:MAG TPA: type VI secretion system baseplate subunit TssG, partial [Acetobacteraceae bacterium]|nr:type VI secretion system baseplate subunit TssG [Acetobacteraceae bacterium]